jgi:polyhydroxyalkanoate synthesis regulator phasin
VIVLSNAFDKEIDHLERVTKATEFFTWIKNDTLLLAQDFGMAPSLLELGGVSGNVSMTSIISTAMRNTIVPLRERYSEQFSGFLSSKLECEKIYFNKYEMVEAGDVDTMRTKYVNMLSLLNAMRIDGQDGEKQIQPKAQELFNDMAEMLKENIHNENGKLEELTMQI